MTAIQVKRLPKDPGQSGWSAILPAPRAPDILEDTVTADWLIIGAGFAGLAAAYRLSQTCPGDQVAVLDATRIGEGPAGRNSGFMIDLPHDLASGNYGGNVDADRDQIKDNRTGIELASEMAQLFDLSSEAFAKVGKINGAATVRGARHLDAYAKHLGALSEPHEMLSANDMHEITGTDYYDQGLLTPGVAMIQPSLFVRSVAEGLRSNRVQIFENSPVIELEKNRDWHARTPKGAVTAPRVILAVNGHLNNFGFMTGRLVHVFTFASMTRRLSPQEVDLLGGKSSWGITSADPMGSSIRRISGTGGDRIVVRNSFVCEPSMEASDQQVYQAGVKHDRSFAARFANLSSVEMEFRWGGRLCLSRNNVQVVEQLDQGLYSACCQNGLGTAKGTLAGMLSADMATGRKSDALDRQLAAPAPSRLPPAMMTKIGANLQITWGQYMAGREM